MYGIPTTEAVRTWPNVELFSSRYMSPNPVPGLTRISREPHMIMGLHGQRLDTVRGGPAVQLTELEESLAPIRGQVLT